MEKGRKEEWKECVLNTQETKTVKETMWTVRRNRRKKITIVSCAERKRYIIYVLLWFSPNQLGLYTYCSEWGESKMRDRKTDKGELRDRENWKNERESDW